MPVSVYVSPDSPWGLPLQVASTYTAIEYPKSKFISMGLGDLETESILLPVENVKEKEKNA